MKLLKILAITIAAVAVSFSATSCAKKTADTTPAPGYVEYGK